MIEKFSTWLHHVLEKSDLIPTVSEAEKQLLKFRQISAKLMPGWTEFPSKSPLERSFSLLGLFPILMREFYLKIQWNLGFSFSFQEGVYYPFKKQPSDENQSAGTSSV